MPTYEYACKGCGEHLEVVQSFKDDALTECPACGGDLRKVFSAAGLIFKGSGWHSKDYATSSRSSSSSSASGETKDSTSSDSSSSTTSTSESSSSASSASSSGTSSSSGEAKSA
jgi:putative FmdB family regulatory protein